MTEYYKQIANGYIVAIGTNGNDVVTVITAEEYSELLEILRSAPEAPKGYEYLLNAKTLEWELIEIPHEEISIDAEEINNILLGNF